MNVNTVQWSKLYCMYGLVMKLAELKLFMVSVYDKYKSIWMKAPVIKH